MFVSEDHLTQNTLAWMLQQTVCWTVQRCKHYHRSCVKLFAWHSCNRLYDGLWDK